MRKKAKKVKYFYKISFYEDIDDELLQALISRAEETGESMRSIIIRALKKELLKKES